MTRQDRTNQSREKIAQIAAESRGDVQKAKNEGTITKTEADNVAKAEREIRKSLDKKELATLEGKSVFSPEYEAAFNKKIQEAEAKKTPAGDKEAMDLRKVKYEADLTRVKMQNAKIIADTKPGEIPKVLPLPIPPKPPAKPAAADPAKAERQKAFAAKYKAANGGNEPPPDVLKAWMADPAT